MVYVRRFARRFFVLAIQALLFACGSEASQPVATPSPSPIQVAAVVTLTSSDCTLAPAATPVRAGVVAFTLINQSGTKAGIDIWLMPDDKAFERLTAQALEDRRLAEAGQPPQSDHAWLGVAPAIRLPWDSSTSQTVRGHLDAGMYAVLCITSFPKVSEPRLLKVVGPLVVRPT
jgi:hypothetical protein